MTDRTCKMRFETLLDGNFSLNKASPSGRKTADIDNDQIKILFENALCVAENREHSKNIQNNFWKLFPPA